VNINTAGEAELESLPGIGEVRARSIVQSRTADGPFGAIEDLVARQVIPESVFADIASLITVSQ
jgi:competence protein ComEA